MLGCPGEMACIPLNYYHSYNQTGYGYCLGRAKQTTIGLGIKNGVDCM